MANTPIKTAITPPILQIIKSGGFNGFPYGIQKVGARYIIGTSQETTERIALNDNFIFTNLSISAAIKNNIYNLYQDSPGLFSKKYPQNGSSPYIFRSIVEISNILYCATNNGVGVSSDYGKTWLFRKTMVDIDLYIIKEYTSQTWISSKRTLGYSTDNFVSVNIIPYSENLDIVDFEIGTFNGNQIAVVCTSNGAYWSVFNNGVWGSWTKSPDPSTSYSGTMGSGTGSGIGYDYITYNNTKPYSNDFRSVVNLGQNFYFGTAMGLVYTSDFQTWSHFEIAPIDSFTTPIIPNSTYGNIKKINNNSAFAAITDGGIVKITDGQPPTFLNLEKPTENTKCVYSVDGLRAIALDMDGTTIRISLDGFLTEFSITPTINASKVFVSPSAGLFYILTSDGSIYSSNDKTIKVSTDSSLRISTSDNSGTKVNVIENYRIFTLYDFTMALINEDANYNLMIMINGSESGYLWFTSLDPLITNRNWYLIGTESSYNDVKTLAQTFGITGS